MASSTVADLRAKFVDKMVSTVNAFEFSSPGYSYLFYLVFKSCSK